MIKPIFIFIAIILLSNCTTVSEKGLDYKLVKYAYQTPDCEPEKDGCLMVSMMYPEFELGDSLARLLANRIIKNSLLDNIGMGDAEAGNILSIEEAVEDLTKGFAKTKEGFNQYGTGWQIDITTDELYRSDSVLVLEISAMTFFGGAHPNYNSRYYNFNRSMGNLLPLSSIVDDMAGFTTKAEAVFKETYKIKEGSSYAEAGFDFLGDKFTLSANFAYLGDSIRLHYNPYEIASYADGDFEITVPIK
jgi:Protein of unknown function (DUF3298)